MGPALGPLTGAARAGLSAKTELSDLGTEDESGDGAKKMSTNSGPGMIMHQ